MESEEIVRCEECRVKLTEKEKRVTKQISYNWCYWCVMRKYLRNKENNRCGIFKRFKEWLGNLVSSILMGGKV